MNRRTFFTSLAPFRVASRPKHVQRFECFVCRGPCGGSARRRSRGGKHPAQKPRRSWSRQRLSYSALFGPTHPEERDTLRGVLHSAVGLFGYMQLP